MSAEAASPTNIGVAPPSEEKSVDARFLASYAFAYFGVFVAMLAPVILTLQLKVGQLQTSSPGTSLSIVLAFGALIAILSNPVCGRLSDRTTSRFGRRRPWLLAGSIVSFIGLFVTAQASNLATLAVGWAISQVGFAALLAVLIALMADQVPARQRGAVSGWLGFAQGFASVASTAVALMLSKSVLLSFAVPGVIMLIATVVFVAILPDRRLSPADRPPLAFGDLARSYWINPRRFPDFSWALASRFAIFMATFMVLSYQLFFLQSRFNLTPEGASKIVLVGIIGQSAAIIVSSAITGWASDRLGHRRLFVGISAAVFAGGLVILILTHSHPAYYLALVFVGLGQGTYHAVDLALITDVLPDRERDAGKDMGLATATANLPQMIAPTIAPVFLAVGAGDNYPVLFGGGVVFAVIAALTIAQVRRAH